MSREAKSEPHEIWLCGKSIIAAEDLGSIIASVDPTGFRHQKKIVQSKSIRHTEFKKSIISKGTTNVRQEPQVVFDENRSAGIS